MKPAVTTLGTVKHSNSLQTKSMAGFIAFRNESRSSTGGGS
jgi:hypothetical protein